VLIVAEQTTNYFHHFNFSSISFFLLLSVGCFYPPPETLATKCLYVGIKIEINKPPGVDAEMLKKSLIDELEKNPITFSR
jgi:hypothetical protein